MSIAIAPARRMRESSSAAGAKAQKLGGARPTPPTRTARTLALALAFDGSVDGRRRTFPLLRLARLHALRDLSALPLERRRGRRGALLLREDGEEDEAERDEPDEPRHRLAEPVALRADVRDDAEDEADRGEEEEFEETPARVLVEEIEQ